MGDRAMQANLTGFSAVYRREFSFVWAAARRLGVHPAALDDAVQDVFITAYRRWDDLDYEVSPRAWLYGVTRRVAFRYRRSEARTARRKSAVAQVRRRNEPHAQLDGAHDVDAVLAVLPEGRREVFVMSELLDMSGPEIAAELKIPLNTVYSRLRLARKQLERKVAGVGARAWIGAARRQDRPPRGQARRCWVLLAPALRRGIPVGLTGTLTVGNLPAVAAVAGVVGLVGLVILVGWWGGRSEPPPERERDPTVAVEVDAPAAPPVASVVAAEEHPAVAGSTPSPRATPPARPADRDAGSPRRSPASSTGEDETSSSAPSPPAVETSEAVESVTPSASSTLAEEVAVLDRATAALRSDDAARALQWLAEHERRFEAGRLVDVRKATRVRVLCRLGRDGQARSEAAALRREHPGSAVARGVPDSCEDV